MKLVDGVFEVKDPAQDVFQVRGSYAARAACRFIGIVTPIQDYFFDNPHGSHAYNVCDDPNDPYLGTKLYPRQVVK